MNFKFWKRKPDPTIVISTKELARRMMNEAMLKSCEILGIDYDKLPAGKQNEIDDKVAALARKIAGAAR